MIYCEVRSEEEICFLYLLLATSKNDFIITPPTYKRPHYTIQVDDIHDLYMKTWEVNKIEILQSYSLYLSVHIPKDLIGGRNSLN